MDKKYKTIHENKNDLEQFWIEDLDLSVRALNSIKSARIHSKEELLNLCSNDMVHLKFGARTIYEISEFQNNYKEVSIIEKMKIPTLMNNLKLSVLSLPKYNSTYGSGGLDCWGEMEEDRDGEYIKLQDVLNLFSTKNS